MKPAGVRGAVRPMSGLRLKINLLLVAIQVPALVILSISITRLTRGLLQENARRQGVQLSKQIADRLSLIRDDPEEIQAGLRDLLTKRSGVRSAAVFLAEEGLLPRRASFGQSAPWEADDETFLSFRDNRSVERFLEPPDPTATVIHRPLESFDGLVKGVIRLEIDESESLAQVEGLNQQLFVGLVVVFALTVLVLFGGMHLLVVSPVKKLVRAMGQSMEGRLEPVAVGPAQDEIGLLAMSYNEMVHRLRHLLDEKGALIREVQDLNANLQLRVEGATRDLAKSHHELERAYLDLYASQRERERLERQVSLGQVAREIAHEFATPLNVISGTLQMLLEDPDLPASHGDRLGRVLAQTERLIQICRDTLSPLKMPASELRPADLNALVEEVGAFMAPAFAARGVEFRPSLSASLPAVRADLHQMEQVLLNLISNALDALPAGGWIEVETALEGGAEPAVVLRVRDNGVGIPPDHLARIFDPFFTTKGAGKGTGLGLAICRDIVSQHRGEIRMVSEPGQGSTVTVRLPAALPVGEAA